MKIEMLSGVDVQDAGRTLRLDAARVYELAPVPAHALLASGLARIAAGLAEKIDPVAAVAEAVDTAPSRRARKRRQRPSK